MKSDYKKSICVFLVVITALIACFTGFSAEDIEPAGKETVCLPIIMYHEVKPYKAGRDVIHPWEFESDLKYLAENGYTTVTMNDLINYVYHGDPLPEKPIILTFDDGYLNNYVYVLPLLEKYKMKMVFSIIGKNSDDFTNIPDSNIDYSHVTWAQLNEMLASGWVEVQNHSYNLHQYKKYQVGCKQMYNETNEEYEIRLMTDIEKLQKKIEVETGFTPNTFTYPYGAYSKNTDMVLKKMGFKATLSCKYGLNRITDDPDCLYGLKRIARSHNRSIGKLLREVLKGSDKKFTSSVPASSK